MPDEKKSDSGAKRKGKLRILREGYEPQRLPRRPPRTPPPKKPSKSES